MRAMKLTIVKLWGRWVKNRGQKKIDLLRERVISEKNLFKNE